MQAILHTGPFTLGTIDRRAKIAMKRFGSEMWTFVHFQLFKHNAKRTPLSRFTSRTKNIHEKKAGRYIPTWRKYHLRKRRSHDHAIVVLSWQNQTVCHQVGSHPHRETIFFLSEKMQISSNCDQQMGRCEDNVDPQM